MTDTECSQQTNCQHQWTLNVTTTTTFSRPTILQRPTPCPQSHSTHTLCIGKVRFAASLINLRPLLLLTLWPRSTDPPNAPTPWLTKNHLPSKSRSLQLNHPAQWIHKLQASPTKSTFTLNHVPYQWQLKKLISTILISSHITLQVGYCHFHLFSHLTEIQK